MRKKNLPANLSLELSVSEMRDWFISEMNYLTDDLHEDAVPSADDIKKYFDSNFPDYRDQLRGEAVDLIMSNLGDVFDDMVHAYHGDIEEKHHELLQKDEAEAMAVDAAMVWDKVRKSLTQAEIDILVKHISPSSN